MATKQQLSAIVDAMKELFVPASLDDPRILGDASISSVTLVELRAAYKVLHTLYVELYKQHHDSITTALAARRDDGKKTGGDVPYGYRLDKDGETLIEDADEQTVIAEAVQLRARHFSFRRIVQELWKKKLYPRPIPKKRLYRKFDPTQVRRMFEAHKARAKLAD